MKRINEIFYSVQGEGFWTGTPSVFVRFSGCNLKCPFCDTRHEEYTEMSDDDIVRAVKEYPCKHVVITGGEPGLWITEELVDKLHAAGKYVTIETNGTKPLPGNIDWITCSPKPYAAPVLSHADEVKIVFLGQDLSRYSTIECSHKFLQPCYNADGTSNIDEVIAYILRNPEWRLSLQTHKMIGVR